LLGLVFLLVAIIWRTGTGAIRRWRPGRTRRFPELPCRSLWQAESAYSEHQTRLATAWITLLKALGMGVEPAGSA
jgi:hypothetical protein